MRTNGTIRDWRIESIGSSYLSLSGPFLSVCSNFHEKTMENALDVPDAADAYVDSLCSNALTVGKSSAPPASYL
jgi:hypothetical protein